MNDKIDTPAVPDVDTPAVDTPTDSPTDTPKTEETPEAKFSRLTRQREQLMKKHGFEDSTEPTTKTNDKKSDELGYGELAYLRSFEITDQAEIDLAQQVMQDTGKSLKDVLNNKYFQADLKEMREAAQADAAIPDSKHGKEGSAKDGVDYWIQKGELPPANQVQLRRDVVNARMKKETDGSKFSQDAVIR
jgi:hypothetical protein